MGQLTLRDLKTALPESLAKRADNKALKRINDLLDDPNMQESFRENFMSFSNILTEGKFKLAQYVDAIKYCSYKISGLTDKDAYIATFPIRYNQHVANGTKPKDIASYISAYNKSKLVTTILERAYVPLWLVNQHAVQEAINTQLELMRDAVSEKVRSDAANSLLVHLKPPETSKVVMDVNVNQTDQMKDLYSTMRDLVSLQKEQIQNKALTAGDIGGIKLIEGSAKDVS